MRRRARSLIAVNKLDGCGGPPSPSLPSPFSLGHILAIIMRLCSVSISVFYLVLLGLVSYCCMCPTLLHAARCACTVTFFVFSQFGCKSSPASLQSAASFCSLMSSYFRVIIFYSVIKRVCAAQTTSMARLRARPRPRQRERENPQQMCEVRAMCVWGILNRISVI